MQLIFELLSVPVVDTCLTKPKYPFNFLKIFTLQSARQSKERRLRISVDTEKAVSMVDTFSLLHRAL